MEEVRRARVPFFMLVLIGPETKSLSAFQGRRGIASVVRWNPRPVIFGVDLAQCEKSYERRVKRIRKTARNVSEKFKAPGLRCYFKMAHRHFSEDLSPPNFRAAPVFRPLLGASEFSAAICRVAMLITSEKKRELDSVKVF